MFLDGFELAELVRAERDFIVLSDRNDEKNEHGDKVIDFIRSKEDDGVDNFCDLFCCFLFEKFDNFLQIFCEVF